MYLQPPNYPRQTEASGAFYLKVLDMRFVLVGPVYPYRGGIAHHTMHLSKAISQRDHVVKVISFYRQYPDWLYPGKNDKDPSQNTMKVEADYILDPFSPWSWSQTFDRIESFSPDLVIFQWWTTFWSIPYARISKVLRRNNILVSYLIHNVLPHEERFYDRWLAHLALQESDSLIVQNPLEKERLLALVPKSHVIINPIPAFHRLTTERKSKIEARERLELPQDQFILLFFGIVREYKGLKFLLEAIARLRNQGKEPSLIVAGEFWQDIEMYQQLIETLDIASLIRVENRYLPNEEADLYLSACDALVAPYIGGTQSAAASIALGYGLPIVLTEHIAAGIPLEYRDSATIVPAGDVDALSKAILGLSSRVGGFKENSHSPSGSWDSLVYTLEKISSKTVK